MAYKPVGVDENGKFPPRVETALSATYGPDAPGLAAKFGPFSVGDGNGKYRHQAAVIRMVGGVWQFIDDANHAKIGFDSISIEGSGTSAYIRLTYGFTASKVGAIVVNTDESFARYGYMAGCSISPTHVDIGISQVTTGIADYVYFDGTNWVSNTGAFTSLVWNNAGKLTLTHARANPNPKPADTPLSFSVTGREGCRVFAGAGSTDTTTVIEFRDAAGALRPTAATDMKCYVIRHTTGAGAVRRVDPTEASLELGASNFWIHGLQEIAPPTP